MSANSHLTSDVHIVPDSSYAALAECTNMVEMLGELLDNCGDGANGLPPRVSDGMSATLKLVRKRLDKILDSFTSATPERLARLLAQ